MSFIKAIQRARRLQRMYNVGGALVDGYESVTDVIDSVGEMREILPESLGAIQHETTPDLFDKFLDELAKRGC